MIIREGDLWEFTTNNGIIQRKITIVGTKRMQYVNASGEKRSCEIATFNRWCRGAHLEFATNWDGRDDA